MSERVIYSSTAPMRERSDTPMACVVRMSCTLRSIDPTCRVLGRESGGGEGDGLVFNVSEREERDLWSTLVLIDELQVTVRVTFAHWPFQEALRLHAEW